MKNEYISYIKNLNSEKELSSKNFFILISIPKIKNEIINMEQIKNKFLERILKLSDGLLKCGNKSLEIIERKEVIEIIDSFMNPYKNNI